ncbi:MAG TPA: flagellar basal body-associated protein FliL [Azonexus sp.]|jgi:flagellar FliL protein|nr:flagellar basal body-associated protein FliL [Azonexus sp.]
MANSTSKDPKAAPKDEEPAPAAPGKKRLILIIALVLVVVLAGAGGAWYFLKSPPPAADGKPDTSKTAKPPVFVPMEPFTVNLQHDDLSPQYLQVGLSLKVADSAVVDALKLHMPEIRNRVLLLLSSKKASDITTLEGKQALSAELMHEISQPLAGSAQAKGVESVLFTSFVIQ